MDTTGSNEGTATGIVYGPGEVEQGFIFDSTGDYITVNNPSGLDFGAGQNFSIEAWIKPEYADTSYGVQTIVDKRYTPSSSEAHGYALFLEYGTLKFQLADDSGGAGHYHNYSSGSGNLRDGNWHHVAVTVNRTDVYGLKFYLDGQQIGGSYDPTVEPGTLASSSPLLIGKHALSTLNAGFKGAMDEVSIYNRVLLANEISLIFNAGPAGKCGECFPSGQCATPVNTMVGWWPGDGWTADLARNHPITLANGASYIQSQVEQGFKFDVTGARAWVPAVSDLDVGTGQGFTIEAWVTPWNTAPGPLFQWCSSTQTGVHLWANWESAGMLYANILDVNNVGRAVRGYNALVVNQPTHIALTYDKASGYGQMYANGQPLGPPTVLGNNFIPRTGIDLYLGYRPLSPASFRGVIDEPSVYNRALSANEILAICNAGYLGLGKCKATLYDPNDSDYDGVTTSAETQAGTDPNNPNSVPNIRLGYFGFADSSFEGEGHRVPTQSSGAQSVVGWIGNGVKRTAGTLVYKAVENDGTANINCRQGIVRFRFAPFWSGGSGPGGTRGDLINVGNGWRISVDGAGNQLSFSTTDGIAATTLVTSSISSWLRNEWYQVCLAYGPVECVLFINGIKVATGGGVPYYPPAWACGQYGLSIGADHQGNFPVNGIIDELEMFNYNDRLRKAIVFGASKYSRDVSTSDTHASGNYANFLDRAPTGWENWMSCGPMTALTAERSVDNNGVARLYTRVDNEPAYWGWHYFKPGDQVNISGLSNAQYHTFSATIERVIDKNATYSLSFQDPDPNVPDTEIIYLAHASEGVLYDQGSGELSKIYAYRRLGPDVTVWTHQNHGRTVSNQISISGLPAASGLNLYPAHVPVTGTNSHPEEAEHWVEYTKPEGLAPEGRQPDVAGIITRNGINVCNQSSWPGLAFAADSKFEICLAYAPFGTWGFPEERLSDAEAAADNGMAILTPHSHNYPPPPLEVQVLPQVRNPPCGLIPVGGGYWSMGGTDCSSEGSWGSELELVDAVGQVPDDPRTPENDARYDRAESWSHAATGAKYAKLKDLHPSWNVFDLRQLLRATATNFDISEDNSGWTREKGFGFAQIENRAGMHPALQEDTELLNSSLSLLPVGDPLQIRAEVSSDGLFVTLSWKNFRQTGFDITVITGAPDANGGTTWYSGNGEAKFWGPAAQDLRGRQPPSEILFRTKLQDGRMSRGFKVVIP